MIMQPSGLVTTLDVMTGLGILLGTIVPMVGMILGSMAVGSALIIHGITLGTIHIFILGMIPGILAMAAGMVGDGHITMAITTPGDIPIISEVAEEVAITTAIQETQEPSIVVVVVIRPIMAEEALSLVIPSVVPA